MPIFMYIHVKEEMVKSSKIDVFNLKFKNKE